MDNKGNIYVTNYGESCIRVFSPDGRYIRKFGSKNYERRRSSIDISDVGQFSPTHKLSSSDSSSTSSPRGSIDVDVFPPQSPRKKPPRRWSSTTDTDVFQFQSRRISSDSDIIQLKSPTSIAIDANNYVYITEEASNSVSIFKTDGEFIRRISQVGPEEEEFNSPYGIAVDDIGNVYVGDTGNNRIIIL